MEIFQEEMDYQIFLMILKKELERGNATLHAFCLMTNHIHLLLETQDVEIGKIMKYICGHYATNYNNRYGYQGHLFEARYKSCIVEDDSYFLQTSRYIHLNPVKARMVVHPEDYRWSSYKTVIGMSDDDITVPDRTLSYFGTQGRVAYRSFVEDIGHKYAVTEQEIHKLIEEDEEWLPW